MSTTIEEPELKDVERRAEQQLSAGDGHLQADIEAQAAADSAPIQQDSLPIRYLLGTGLTVAAAGLMVGGIFHAGGIPEDPTTGITPRVYAIVAGLLGLALAAALSRLRGPLVVGVLAIIGIFFIGVLMTVPYGAAHVTNIGADVKNAADLSHISRPPLDFVAGWAAIEAWIMGTLGFGAGWLVLSVGWPSVGVVAPLALGVFAGISDPKGAQVPSGIALVALFGASLAVISGAQSVGDGESLPAAYEVRRALRTAPIFAVVLAVLFIGAQTNFLFPHQLIDPAQQPQHPHPIALNGAADRDLFDVSDTTVSGPWVLGHLDVYDGTAWLLPSYASSQSAFQDIPSNGYVDRSLPLGARATFTIRGLSGAVLPDLPDTVIIVAKGPRLVYDGRNGNIRLVEGQAQAGFSYSVGAAGPASVDHLKALGNIYRVPDNIQQFEQVPSPPAAVKGLIAQAPKTSKWEEFDWLRSWVLANVVADGPGTPVDIPPARADQIIRKKDGSPYEIVALQALLARWIGVPSRIGYGFDGGKAVGQGTSAHVEVHPSNGVSFPEVWFPGVKWVPVIGTPAKARTTESGGVKQQNPNVLPSQDIGVPLYVPYLTPNASLLYQQLAPLGALLLALIAAALIVYFSLPAVVKLARRARRRDLAHRSGPRAELVQAYAEWRDAAMDYGYQHPTDTPLHFTTRFVPDEEHSQFAWLVTRALWGDLQGQITPELAAQAREFSRRLRQRLAQAHPITVRGVALLSRLSMRHPFHISDAAPPAAGAQPRRVA
ncbi:MAG TPA: transglutaminase-like domain-containing protein [Candidatus Dormibacteraeota bacterium]